MLHGSVPLTDLSTAFNDSARVHSGRIALIQGERQVSYARLDRLSDAIATRLAALGAGPGERVGVAARTGIGTIAAILGIIKSGAAYVPLTVTYPAERLRLIAREAGLRLAVGDLPALEGSGIRLVSLAELDAAAEAERMADLAPVRAPVDLEAAAYVMFTSGSTGMPKGVVVPHRAVLRLTVGQDFMALGPDERILQNSPIGFDAATLEIWGALLNGATLVLPAEDAAPSLRGLGEAIARDGITTLWLTAGLFHAMADERPGDFAPLRQLLTGGDVVSPARVAKVLAACPGLTVINGYGPTENTTFTCCHRITAADLASGKALPIGRPIRGTEVFVLDQGLQPVADGATGELCAAGAGLALGYLGRPDLTAEAFVRAPWDAQKLIYRTGDLARREPDGTISYLGRIDTQVKLRGFRVELGEIETALEQHPAVRQAAAVALGGADVADKRLVAFHSGERIAEQALRDHLAGRLPDHAVPSRLFRIETLPLNDNGKLDRKALAALAEARLNAGVADGRPLRDLEGAIVAELAQVLGRAPEDLGRNVNFFDLGASSLHVARVHERLQRLLGRDFPIADFFGYSTVATLAAHLGGEQDSADAAEAVRAPRRPDADEGLIAIVGMAGRFPGAPDVDSFWQALVEGRELISHFSAAELEIDPAAADPSTPYVPARGVMEGADLFDARHFGIPPKEAERMDPQHRIMLELAQTALETAGHDPERFAGRIGIFTGVSQNSYLLNNLVSGPGAAADFAAGYPVRDFATLFGNDKDFLATRIAYKLNLRGPAVNVQCACSTSLVAVAQACESLRAGISDMALAGGVSVTFPSRRPYPYMPDGMASSDGHCRTFDAEATGTVFGDGAGLVVLRRLSDALADGDRVIAVIRGWSLNNDGSEKAGYAAPSIKAQAAVIRAAHEAAGVSPRSIGYVEAHGTATPLGDPIEFAALHQAFSAGTQDRGFCALGSAKTNVGHLDIAAGVTGLIKTALTLDRGVIPPLLHYQAPNPRIDFDHSAFYPAAARQDWPRGDLPRRAGVSAFGVGGTNIHMILEEAPLADTEAARTTASAGPRVFPVSASTPEALAAGVARLGDWAAAHPAADPDAVAATLRDGRRALPERAVLVAADMKGLAAACAAGTRGVTAGAAGPVAFLFPGQGSQHVGMAQDLFAAEPVFRAALTECTTILKAELGLDLLEVIHAPAERQDEMTLRLKDTALAQPAIFATSYALARQWEAWGIRAEVMIGHSIGEFVAATLAGVMRLEDALKLIALRGRLMAGLPGGVMVSVRGSEADLLPFLGAGLDLAAVNGPKACVLAGSEQAAAEILPRIEAAGMVTSRLHTSHAFHSHMMEPAVPAFRAAVAALDLKAPQTPILSTVTGDWLTPAEATDPDYWAGHMRRPVRFLDALSVLWAEGRHLFLESGPGRTLSVLAAQNPDRRKARPAVASLPHAQAEDRDSLRSMREAFGMLWAHGLPVDWRLMDANAGSARRATGLPTYPFQRKRFWVEPAARQPRPVAEAAQAADDTTAEAVAETAPVSSADAIRAMLSDLSGLDPSEMDGGASFLALGFDSLLLTQATRELSDRFGVSVTLRQLIDGLPDIDSLAAHVDAHGTRPAATAAVPAPAELTRIEPAADEAAPSSAPMTRITREVETLTPVQQAHIDRLVARYTAKTAKSKQLTARYRPVHADPRTASGFNRLWKEIVYQIVTTRSKGSRLIDVDGNEYIDILNGFGPGFLGHSPEPVLRAVHDQLDAGFEVGPQSLAAMEAADLFCQVTGNDRASFVCTGSEAVYAAMRLARTVTGRDRVVMFARDYHGNFDEVLVRGIDGKDGPRTLPLAPGIPRDSVKNVVVLPYGTPQALDWIRANAASLAAVIVEPVQSRRPEFRPAEFIREVRRITENAGSLFIFDEVVTGFRFGPRGAQGYYDVKADLVTYGKVVGGGLPVGVVSGQARFMDTFDGGAWGYGDDSFPAAPVTFFAGTFVRHPLAMASLRAMLTFFRDQPDFFWKTVNAKGDRLAGTVDRWFADNDMPFRMPNCGSLMYLRIDEDQRFGPLLGAHMRDRGVFLLEGFPSYMTAAHDDADIDHVIEAFKDSALEMRAAGMLTGRAAVAHDGPLVSAVPPRLSLPGGAEKIAAQMAAPLQPLTVPATEAQREIWAAMIVTPELAPAYNESVSLKIRGPIDRRALTEAAVRAFGRHDALRSTFSEDGADMRIQPVLTIEVPLVDLTALDATHQAERLAAILHDEAEHPFDMQAGPFVRACLVAFAEDHHHLIVTAHHIVCDGWSIDVIMRDMGAIYDALRQGRRPVLPPAQSIIDYARAENEWARTAAAAETRDFWLTRFADLPPVLDLPADRPRTAPRGVRGARVDRVLPADLVARLRALARGKGATFVNLMLAAYKAFVADLAQVSDVVIGLPASGQAARGMPMVVGHCVNLLPIRTRIDWDQGFGAHLGQVRGAMLDAFDHQSFTYGELIRALRLPRDPARVMLVPVIFNIDNGIDLSSMSFGPVETDFVTNPRSYEHFELYLNLTDSPAEVRTEWSYSAALFDQATIDGFIARFEAFLGRICDGPDRPLAELMRDGAAQPTPEEWQGEIADYPRGATLAGLFAERVARAPGATAVIEGDRTVSYDQLDREARAIAARLAARGIGAGDVVGLCMDRSARMIAAMLGVMRLGAAYVALAPVNPDARLAFMLADSGARAVLADAAQAGRFDPALVLRTDDLTVDEVAAAPAMAPVPGPLAYVTYTSGSTGTPKGVMGTHDATLNRFAWMWAAFPFQPGEVMCQKTAIGFVDVVWEIFGPLLAGVPQVIVPDATVRDPAALVALLGAQGVSRLLVVPSLLGAVLDSGIDIAAVAPRLRLVVTSGERLPAGIARRLRAAAPQITLVNLYGSSEVAADVTCEIVGTVEGEDVPIGRAIQNARLYVLDRARHPVAPGGAGELYVGGEVLAAGYLNRPDLTAERFLPDPFSRLPGARMFATGDRVRFLPDGRLQFLGRADDQVKIRGARVELGEIEAALAGQPGVAEAVAVLHSPASGDPVLAAYVTGQPGAARPDPADLRLSLLRRLPDYMIPARITVLETMPRNAAGKVDRPELARRPLDAAAAGAAAAWPATATERELHEIWCRVLGQSDIGLDDDFFARGGHSLTAVKLFAQIRRGFGADLPISTLFAHPTIRSLARRIGGAGGTGGAVLAPQAAAFAGAPEDSPWDTTVVIAAGPDGTTALPLFVVGGVGGNVNNLIHLGKAVGRSRPVIGLQTRGILGHRMLPSLEAMATDHITHIRRRQPQGPYLLAGYSGGSITAFEIARQLDAAGEKVAFLGILDMFAPGFAAQTAPGAGGRLVNEARLMVERGPGFFIRRLRPWLRDRIMTDRLLAFGMRLRPEKFRIMQVSRQWWKVTRGFRAQPYPGDLWLFLAAEAANYKTRRMREADPEFGWGPLVGGRLEVALLKADHFTMVKQEGSEELALSMESAIGAALAGAEARG